MEDSEITSSNQFPISQETISKTNTEPSEIKPVMQESSNISVAFCPCKYGNCSTDANGGKTVNLFQGSLA